MEKNRCIQNLRAFSRNFSQGCENSFFPACLIDGRPVESFRKSAVISWAELKPFPSLSPVDDTAIFHQPFYYAPRYDNESTVRIRRSLCVRFYIAILSVGKRNVWIANEVFRSLTAGRYDGSEPFKYYARAHLPRFINSN